MSQNRLRFRVCSATLTATVPRATRIWRVDVPTLLFQACAGGLPRERPQLLVVLHCVCMLATMRA